MILLLLAAVQSDPDVLLSKARTLLAAPCESADCAAPSSDARFRIAGDDASTDTSKDRAIDDDGTKCNVVGARRCTKRGRTIFRTDLAR